jgi:predicted protein tyrosine phosphatase
MHLPVEFTVVPRNRVARNLLSKSRGPLFRSMISIGDPGSRYPTGYRTVPATIRIECADVSDPSDPLGPTRHDVSQIIGFARTIARLGGRCLIHCEAGISRSTAAAAIVARVLLGAGSEADVVAHVKALVPDARPNRLMIAFADDLIPDCHLAQALAGEPPSANLKGGLAAASEEPAAQQAVAADGAGPGLWYTTV